MKPRMNPEFVLSLGAFTVGMVMFNIERVKRTLSEFKQWAIDNGWTGAIIYGGACGVLVGGITFPWGY